MNKRPEGRMVRRENRRQAGKLAARSRGDASMKQSPESRSIENGHRAIIGVTRSGKTTWAKLLCEGLAARGKFVGVFDPREPRGAAGWPGCRLFTRDPVKLLDWAQAHTSADVGAPIYLFWDEWGPYVGRAGKTAQRFSWLGTTSRHNGITNTVIAHRLQNVDPALRENIDLVWAFRQKARGADMLDAEFGNNDGVLSIELKNLPRLKFKELGDLAEARSATIAFVRGKPRVTFDQ